MDELDRILANQKVYSDWKNCETPDCGYKVCTWSNNKLCFKCHESIVGKKEMIRMFNETHDKQWDELD